MPRKRTGKLPALLFYTGDWLKDPQLSMCSPATRGIWMDLLCAMHENGRTGTLSGTTDQIARVCRCSPADLSSALDELSCTKAANVTLRNGTVTVENRRMVRESKTRLLTQNRVNRHREECAKKPCNADVTRTLSSSSSVSPPKAPHKGGLEEHLPAWTREQDPATREAMKKAYERSVAEEDALNAKLAQFRTGR